MFSLLKLIRRAPEIHAVGADAVAGSSSAARRVGRGVLGHNGAGRALLYGMALEGAVISLLLVLMVLGAIIGVASGPAGQSVAVAGVFCFYVGSLVILTLTLLGLAGAARHNYADPIKRESAAKLQLVIGSAGVLVTTFVAWRHSSTTMALIVAGIGAIFCFRELSRTKHQSSVTTSEQTIYPRPAEPITVQAPTGAFPPLETAEAALRTTATTVDGSQPPDGPISADEDPREDAPRNVSSETIEDVLRDLHAMIGMEAVKEQVERLIARMEINEKRRAIGAKAKAPDLNCVFVGPPGTGKTTVAGLLIRAYAALGFLPAGAAFAEAQDRVSRSNFVGDVQGATEKKTEDLFDSHLGRGLFIDEAYSLVKDEGDTFGRIIVDVLTNRIDAHRGQIALILAGYEAEIDAFLGVNPGLASRFPNRLVFDNYSAAELQQIFRAKVAEEEYRLDDAADAAMIEAVSRIFGADGHRPTFGNGREMRTLADNAIEAHSDRYRGADPSADELLTLTADDIVRAYELHESRRPRRVDGRA